MAEAVLSREAEFGVNLSGSTHPDLVSAPVVQDEFVLLCRDDHALAGLCDERTVDHPVLHIFAKDIRRAVLQRGG
mgnify:CR=1 FL=1